MAESYTSPTDEHINTPRHSVEPNSTLSKTTTVRAKRPKVSFSFEDVEMKDEAPTTFVTYH
jgi:hypothetical protein